MATVTDSAVNSQLPAAGVTAVEQKKTKAAREAKVAKAAAQKKARSSPSHPPFLQMITDAIVALKERTGSSQYAITKFNEEKHKQLPSNFRKLLLFHLKKSVASGKLVKVKNSFKLAPTRSAPVKPASAPAKKPAAVKPKKNKSKAAKTAAAKPK
ncbi:histone H1-like, partial [Carica papaya]|uniref:histone H1-like n=1 Tax=Carica papaya TaxID=3649 RepID=UPI000B8CC770